MAARAEMPVAITSTGLLPNLIIGSKEPMPRKSPPERAEYSPTESAALQFKLNHHNTKSGFLLRAAMALHDHTICPRLRVLRLFTAPSEMRFGNICIGCARKGPLCPTL